MDRVAQMLSKGAAAAVSRHGLPQESPAGGPPDEPVRQQVAAARKQLFSRAEALRDDDGGRETMIRVGVGRPEDMQEYTWVVVEGVSGSGARLAGREVVTEEMEFGQCVQCSATLTALMSEQDRNPTWAAVAQSVWEHFESSVGCIELVCYLL